MSGPLFTPIDHFLLEYQKKTYKDVYTRILIEEGEKQKILKYVQGSRLSVENYLKKKADWFDPTIAEADELLGKREHK